MRTPRTAQREASTPNILPLLKAKTPRLDDLRFRALLAPADWAALPDAVRKRFSKRVSEGATIVYKGRVTSVFYSRMGWALAQALRLARAPLPLSRKAGLESVVTVTEDRASKGQFWTRMFARETGFPQMIHSVKRFAGKTGIEEALPFGIVMALRLSVERGALCFRSAGYAIAIGAFRLPLPAFLTPGTLLVTHSEIDASIFRFTMTLEHKLLGVLLHQEAVYEEETP